MKKLFTKIAITVLLITQLATPVFACEPDPHTQGYWKNHDFVQIEGDLGDYSWKEVLNTPTRGDAWYILAHQWIAYRLNREYQHCPWENELYKALQILSENKPGKIPANLRSTAIDLAEKLDAYNNGYFNQ